MYRAFNSRVALRAMSRGIAPATCVGAFVATRPVIRCDAPTLATGPPRRNRSFDVSPDTVRQLSSGSVAGMFLPLDNPKTKNWLMIGSRIWSWGCSRPLFTNSCVPCRSDCLLHPCKSYPLLSAQPLVSHNQLASRWGLDIPRTLGIEKLLKKSSIWNKSKNRPLFTASFLATFILATFVRL